MDQISEKGYLPEFHHGLMHKSIAAKDARKLLDARTAVDTEWKKLTHLPAWDSKKVKPKSEVVQQAKKDGRSVYVAVTMNFCHLKHSELVKHLHRYKGRCSRRDDVKDDSGYRAVFTEPGAEAFQMAAATHPGCKCQTLWHGRRPTTRYRHSCRYACQKPPRCCDCQKKSADKCG